MTLVQQLITQINYLRQATAEAGGVPDAFLEGYDQACHDLTQILERAGAEAPAGRIVVRGAWQLVAHADGGVELVPLPDPPGALPAPAPDPDVPQ